MPLGDALAEQDERDERHQDAVGSGEERVLARGGVDQAERLRGIGRPDHAAHEHAEAQVLAIEMRLDALAEDDEHDDRRQQESAGEQHERGDRIQHGLHGQEGITPDERHGDEHELPKQGRTGTGASKLTRSAVLRRYGDGILARKRVELLDLDGALLLRGRRPTLFDHGLQLSPRLAFSLISHTGSASTGVFPGAALIRAFHRTHVLYGFDGGDIISTLAIDAGHPGSPAHPSVVSAPHGRHSASHSSSVGPPTQETLPYALPAAQRTALKRWLGICENDGPSFALAPCGEAQTLAQRSTYATDISGNGATGGWSARCSPSIFSIQIMLYQRPPLNPHW